MEYPVVYAVLLNWNGWSDTIECLKSLGKLVYPNYTVMVVDNGSTNDSVQRIRELSPGIEVIETNRNLGFAGGCNAGIRLALSRGAEYVWLLNNDTKVDSGALSTMVRMAEADSRIGAVGSVICDMEPPHNVQAWGGGRVSLWFGRASHCAKETSNDKLGYLTGASLLLRCEALEDVGLLDEGFFMYAEDADLCFRLRKGGWKLAVADESRIFHKENGSLGRKNSTFDLYVWTSMVRLCGRYAPIPFIPIVTLTLRMISKRVLLMEWTRAGRLCRGVAELWRNQRSAGSVSETDS